MRRAVRGGLPDAALGPARFDPRRAPHGLLPLLASLLAPEPAQRRASGADVRAASYFAGLDWERLPAVPVPGVSDVAHVVAGTRPLDTRPRPLPPPTIGGLPRPAT